MAKCAWCGKEFDISSARRSIGASFGAGMYDESEGSFGSEWPICVSCLYPELSGAIATGEEIEELMYGHDWEED